MTPPRIGISLGDPAGIGPEVALKAAASKDIHETSILLFGTRSLVDHELRSLGLDLTIPSHKEASAPLGLYEVEAPPVTSRGLPSRDNGRSSFLFFDRAVQEAQKGAIQALVTAPISKHSWSLAGVQWTGHTDYLHHLYPEAIMAFWSSKLKVALFSHHMPLQRAVAEVKKDRLLAFFNTLHSNLARVRGPAIQLLVAGLNPHAGEEGLLGTEEVTEVRPAVVEARRQGINIDGPFPPDVVFRRALNRTDVVVIALYHDQGLVPFKLISFEEGVNTTLGLPFFRTSPDHGTAFDLAGQGKANPQSMIEAIKLACRFCSAPPSERKK